MPLFLRASTTAKAPTLLTAPVATPLLLIAAASRSTSSWNTFAPPPLPHHDLGFKKDTCSELARDQEREIKSRDGKKEVLKF